METLLNLLWVLIAVAATITWRTRWIRDPRRIQRKPIAEWTAIVCALVLLFFAVSLTDDLHAEVMLSDDNFVGRRHSSSVIAPAHSGKNLRATSAALLHVVPTIQPLRESARVEIHQPPVGLWLEDSETSSRAPPSLL
jgi:hypothetical protein